MGMWNSTCAISQLPILKGEAAYLVLLAKSPEGYATERSGYTGGHALWAPWSLPIRGVYDAYGRVEVPEGWHQDFVLKRLQETVVPLSEGSNPFREPAIVAADFERDDKLLQLQVRVHNGRIHVRIDVDGKEVVALGACHIRSDVYHHLVENPAYTEDRVLTVDDHLTTMRKNLSEVKPSPLHTGEMAGALRAIQGTDLAGIVSKTLDNLERYKRLAGAVGSYGPTGYLGIGTYRVYLTDQMLSGVALDHPDVEDAVLQHSQFLHVLAHFEFLRKLWQPQNGAGSQATGWGSHAALAAFVSKIAMRAFEEETGRYEDPKAVVPER